MDIFTFVKSFLKVKFFLPITYYIGLYFIILFSYRFFEFHSSDFILEMMIFFPLKINLFFQRFVEFRQKIYDRITIFILNKKYISSLLLYYHKFLYIISYNIEDFFEKINKKFPPMAFALILSLVASRLHLVEIVFFSFLGYLSFNYSAVFMDRFYIRNPSYLNNHIVGPYIQKRGMKRILQPIMENPQIATAVGTAVAGALAWKGLDVHDTYKNADIAAADREQDERHHQDEMAKAAADREEARLTREQAERHHQDEMAMRERELNSNSGSK